MDFLKVFVVLCLVATALGGYSGTPSYCGFQPPQNPPSIPYPKVPANSALELKQVVTVIRHGDRTISTDDECWPSLTLPYECGLDSASVPIANPFVQNIDSPPVLYRKMYMQTKNYYPGNCGTGELTSIGYHQHLLNGEMLRNTYVQPSNSPLAYLASNFSSKAVWIRSTDYDRTFQSAQSLLQTMFPLKNNIGVSSIRDIHTMDDYYETMDPNDNVCAILGDYFDEYTKTAEYQEVYQSQIVPLMQQLSQQLNRSVSSMSDINHLHDCFDVQLCHGFEIPVSKDLWQQTELAYTWNKAQVYSYPSEQRFGQVGIGFLLQEIINRMQAKVNSANSQKSPSSSPSSGYASESRSAPSKAKLPVHDFLLYSAHDTTLAPLLVALQVWDGVWVPYASMVNLELYNLTSFATSSPQSADVSSSSSSSESTSSSHMHGYESSASSQWAVRIVYNGKVMEMPGCGGELCPWSVFLQQTKPYLPVPGTC